MYRYMFIADVWFLHTHTCITYPADEKAYLQYERGDDLLDLQHTVVPEAFRGKGVAKILAKVCLEGGAYGIARPWFQLDHFVIKR